MRIVVLTFGFLSRFSQRLRAAWNLAVSNGAFRQNFPNTAVARSSFGCLLTIALALGGLSCGTCGLRPFVSSISPNSTPAGGNPFLLTINGSDFRPDSLVSWNGSFRVTSFLSSHRLAAGIAAADIARPGAVLVPDIGAGKKRGSCKRRKHANLMSLDFLATNKEIAESQ
jgi:hypothetical protein